VGEVIVRGGEIEPRIEGLPLVAYNARFLEARKDN
jgi:hypothetical protein